MNFHRILIIVACIITLAGCGKANEAVAGFTGYSTTCVEGVRYVQFSSGAALLVDPSGKPRTCSESK